MKILLINPPTPNIIRTNLPAVIEDETGTFPPLGLLYIAAYVEEITDCEVKILDCQAEKINHNLLPAVIREINPNVVGIQSMTFTIIDAMITARTVRKEVPSAFIVLGGPHPTIYTKETASIPEVDAAIAGEGEISFAALIKALKTGKAVEAIPGVITKKNLNLPVTWEHIQNLDILKMPARHLIDTNKYSSPLAKINPLTTMMSSRGCPAKCIFCDRPQMGKVFRKRSADKVVEEMRHCKENYGIKEILFYDDTFTINKQRVFDICNLIIEHDIEVFWDIRARVDTVTPEMLERLHKAGCHRIHYGVESGSPRIQKRLGKNLDLKKVKEVFTLTKKIGIETLGYFMIGCPDEKEDDLKATLDIINILPMDYAHITIFTPYPGTKIYQEALTTGFYKNDYWKDFAENPREGFTPRYWNQHFSDEELLQQVRKAYFRFYSRPYYLFNRLLKVRSIDEFAKKVTLGIKLLKSSYFN